MFASMLHLLSNQPQMAIFNAGKNLTNKKVFIVCTASATPTNKSQNIKMVADVERWYARIHITHGSLQGWN